MIHINEYAFVLDGDKPIVKPELDMLTVMTTEFTRVVIPCKPSHPLTEMYLTHDRVQVPNRFHFTHSLTHSHISKPLPISVKTEWNQNLTIFYSHRVFHLMGLSVLMYIYFGMELMDGIPSFIYCRLDR